MRRSPIAGQMLRWVDDPEIGAVLFESALITETFTPGCPLRGLSVAQIRKLSAEAAASYVRVCDELDVLFELADKERRAKVLTALCANPHLPVLPKVSLLADRWSRYEPSFHLMVRSMDLRDVLQLVAGIETALGYTVVSGRTDGMAESRIAARMIAELSDDDLAREGTGRWALPIYRELDASTASALATARRVDAIVGPHVPFDQGPNLQLDFVGRKLAERLADIANPADWKYSSYGARRITATCRFDPAAARLLVAANPAWKDTVINQLPPATEDAFSPVELSELVRDLIAGDCELPSRHVMGTIALSVCHAGQIDPTTLDVLVRAALSDTTPGYQITRLIEVLEDQEIPTDCLQSSLHRLLGDLNHDEIVGLLMVQSHTSADLALDPSQLLDLFERLGDPAETDAEEAVDEGMVLDALFAAANALAAGAQTEDSDRALAWLVPRLCANPSGAIQFLHGNADRLPASTITAMLQALLVKTSPEDPNDTLDLTGDDAALAADLAVRTAGLTTPERIAFVLATTTGSTLESWLCGVDTVAPATPDDMRLFAETANRCESVRTSTGTALPTPGGRLTYLQLDWSSCARTNLTATDALAESLNCIVPWALRAHTTDVDADLVRYATDYLARHLDSPTAWKALLTLVPEWEGRIGELAELANLLASKEHIS